MADAEAPKILGVSMDPDAHGWHMRFGGLWVQAEYDGAGSWYPYVGDHLVDCACSSLETCRLAIERELLAIRDAIPARAAEQAEGEPSASQEPSPVDAGEPYANVSRDKALADISKRYEYDSFDFDGALNAAYSAGRASAKAEQAPSSLLAQMANVLWNLGRGAKFTEREREICKQLAAEYDAKRIVGERG